ncbi:MnhB domain-containing protein [Isachenkonia alkalipeptolytica]|nr:MnhB domain-containing protein [Isachenkonia alkalipeptolytica]
MIKKLMLLLMFGFIFLYALTATAPLADSFPETSIGETVIHRGYDETASKNLVAAILLDYRLFDSIFEAGILLISAAGVLYMSRSSGFSKPFPRAKEAAVPKDSDSILAVSRILYPFMLLFGFYIIVFGDLSPGGGFQGGVILATARLISVYIPEKASENTDPLNRLEKILFLCLLILGFISLFTRGTPFTNFFSGSVDPEFRRLFLVLLNLLIGLKVSSGLTIIFIRFIKEGK